jgi:hypothetical protein
VRYVPAKARRKYTLLACTSVTHVSPVPILNIQCPQSTMTFAPECSHSIHWILFLVICVLLVYYPGCASMKLNFVLATFGLSLDCYPGRVVHPGTSHTRLSFCDEAIWYCLTMYVFLCLYFAQYLSIQFRSPAPIDGNTVRRTPSQNRLDKFAITEYVNAVPSIL